eukprot:scaffold83402_cov69-Phaeocystis_antarctica.AAC.2
MHPGDRVPGGGRAPPRTGWPLRDCSLLLSADWPRSVHRAWHRPHPAAARVRSSFARNRFSDSLQSALILGCGKASFHARCGAALLRTV